MSAPNQETGSLQSGSTESGPIQFSKEQAMLLDIARRFFAEKWPIDSVRDRLESERKLDRRRWDEMIELGWHGMAVPEQHGGIGLGLTELVTLVEPMGRHLFTSPFQTSQWVIQALLAGADEEQKSEWLPRLAAGEMAAVALSEPSGSWSLDALVATGRVSGNGLELSGIKTFVENANEANLFLVSVAREDGAPALALLERDQLPEGALSPEVAIDLTRISSTLTLDGISVASEALIEGDSARHALSALWRAATLLLAAEACGGTSGVLEVTLDYLRSRVQFGKPIGAYQALKHPTVDALVGLERSRSHLYHAATLLDREAARAEDPPGREAEIALRMAKAEASDAFAFAADRAIQFHGGVGFTWECDAQLYLRRALWCQYQFGDAVHHRTHLAELLGLG